MRQLASVHPISAADITPALQWHMKQQPLLRRMGAGYQLPHLCVEHAIIRDPAEGKGVVVLDSWRWKDPLPRQSGEPVSPIFLGCFGAIGREKKISTEHSGLLSVLHHRGPSHLKSLHRANRRDEPTISTVSHYPYQEFAKIFIRSKQLTEGLSQYGIVSNKTFTLRWPDLPDELLRHFLRGYVDGDGGFYTGRTAYPRKNVIFSVTSNEQFLEGMQQFLMTTLGLPKTKHTQRHEDSPIFTLRYCGRKQVERIITWLYIGATVYLPRKYTKIIDYLQNTPPI